MVLIPIKVQGKRELFVDRQALYTDIGFGFDEDGQKFCRVLEARLPSANYGNRSRDPWEGLPWLTLVLGSGCLDLFEDPAAIISRVRQTVTAQLDDSFWNQILGLTGFEQAIRDNLLADLLDDVPGFASSLVAERLDFKSWELATTGAVTPQPASVSGFEVTGVAARFSLFSFLLTRLYYLASSEAVVIPARNADPIVSLDRLQWQQDRIRSGDYRNNTSALTFELLKPVVRSLLDLSDHGRGPEDVAQKFRRPIYEFLERIDQELSRGDDRSRLAFSDVRAALDITWLLLAKGSEAYPGWSDLLFSLTCWDDNEGLGRRRPWFKSLERESEFIKELFTDATKASWRRQSDPSQEPSVRDRFYNTAAEVLWAQSQRVHKQEDAIRNGSLGKSLPPASAMVASFDLELEFALLRSGREPTNERRSFYIVVPVHVYFRDEDARDARPYWLRARISCEPSNSEEEECDKWSEALRVEQWEVLRDTGNDVTLLDGPHVVRVSGCPLLDLPYDESDPLILELTKELGGGQQLIVEPAVTLDEHHAIQQADAEFFFRLSQSVKGRSLPKQLYTSSPEADSSGERNPRFWMTLGVPVEDPAIRHRLASFLFDRGSWTINAPPAQGPELSGAMKGMGPKHVKVKPGAEISGLVIDKRVSDDDVHLLLWIGFDVVSDSANQFEGDLLHYAAHVRSDEGMAAWRAVSESCRFKPEGNIGVGHE